MCYMCTESWCSQNAENESNKTIVKWFDGYTRSARRASVEARAVRDAVAVARRRLAPRVGSGALQNKPTSFPAGRVL